MAGARIGWALAAGLALLVGTAGCNRSGSAAGGQATADPSPSADPGSPGHAYGSARGGGRYGGGGQDDRDAPVPMFHGEPMWSANRSHTAQENAEYHFERAGADLGARTLDEFLTKVHRFCDHPPAGALHLTRANGDRLIYDPRSNIFAVATREGAPRTVFKPTDGMAYWDQQKARELADAQGGGGDEGYGRRSRRRYEDEGGGGSDRGGHDRGGYDRGGGRYGEDRSDR